MTPVTVAGKEGTFCVATTVLLPFTYYAGNLTSFYILQYTYTVSQLHMMLLGQVGN